MRCLVCKCLLGNLRFISCCYLHKILKDIENADYSLWIVKATKDNASFYIIASYGRSCGKGWSKSLLSPKGQRIFHQKA
jgi:hypothetical protein